MGSFNDLSNTQNISPCNLLENDEDVDINHFFEVYGERIHYDSEKLFLTEFLYPILGKRWLKYLIPQYPFIDSAGRSRKIDFVFKIDQVKIAFEVDGESYHSEDNITKELFDDNLNRQNEIILNGWLLQRFSYNQLLDQSQRNLVMDSIQRTFEKKYPSVVYGNIKPHYLQKLALDALDFYRNKGWTKGIVVLPPGTGKTFLSAFDSKKFDGRILFIVHKLDILNQSKKAFELVWPDVETGLLTGVDKENIENSRILFASKDTLRNPHYLYKFLPDEFDYIIVDEVHHGQAPTYRSIINYFEPNFMLGMTGTPDRTDRRDIFELFDYNKVFEYTINDAIENGFLVPFEYHGFKDNINYSNIRYNGHKYNVQDLDRYLIIKERNELIFEKYIECGKGNKAIGFCCSINHANDMANFFSERGIPSISITSQSDDRDKKIEDFRNSKYYVAFTVDLFNEGIDVPEVRILLFLRPTESKTVFMQQLGRGLRLCSGKDKAIILDFIGNYKRANQIRRYLSKGDPKEVKDVHGSIEKLIYEFSPGCEVIFDEEVEELLDSQDRDDMGISKEDLISAYYKLAEKLGRKPTQADINSDGEYKTSRYVNSFGSWYKFLKEIGEYTEASYHYPQGLHLGHVLYILKILGRNETLNSYLEEKYIRLRGNYAEGELGHFQREVKYKLQGMMEMGLIIDDRNYPDEGYILELTPDGKELYDLLKNLIENIDLSFSREKKSLSWRMNLNPSEFNKQIWDHIKSNEYKRNFVRNLFLKVPAVSQMLNYLYKVGRKKDIIKSEIYNEFFNVPFVKMYCDQEGIKPATLESSRRRCPFLINILHSIGILDQTRSDVSINVFLVCKETMRLKPDDEELLLEKRIKIVSNYLEKKTSSDSEEESLLKEAYGVEFLRDDYYLDKFDFLEEI